jgi:hypothetical protein
MKCTECGEDIVRSKPCAYAYDGLGLDNVVLTEIEVRECTACNWSAPGIPQPSALHRAIAKDLLHERRLLSGRELRFLRKILDWSEEALARHLGVEPFIVGAWEHDCNDGTERIESPVLPALMAPIDRLLRVLVAYRLEAPLDIFNVFPDVKDQKTPCIRKAAFRDGAWTVAKERVA